MHIMLMTFDFCWLCGINVLSQCLQLELQSCQRTICRHVSVRYVSQPRLKRISFNPLLPRDATATFGALLLLHFSPSWRFVCTLSKWLNMSSGF